eukprot:1161828-Pelagomonas_calceolata.AAC.11
MTPRQAQPAGVCSPFVPELRTCRLQQDASQAAEARDAEAGRAMAALQDELRRAAQAEADLKRELQDAQLQLGRPPLPTGVGRSHCSCRSDTPHLRCGICPVMRAHNAGGDEVRLYPLVVWRMSCTAGAQCWQG